MVEILLIYYSCSVMAKAAFIDCLHRRMHPVRVEFFWKATQFIDRSYHTFKFGGQLHFPINCKRCGLIQRLPTMFIMALLLLNQKWVPRLLFFEVFTPIRSRKLLYPPFFKGESRRREVFETHPRICMRTVMQERALL